MGLGLGFRVKCFGMQGGFRGIGGFGVCGFAGVISEALDPTVPFPRLRFKGFPKATSLESWRSVVLQTIGH